MHILILFSGNLFAYQLHISDNPNDDGARLIIRWEKLPPAELQSLNPEMYLLERSVSRDTGFARVNDIARNDTTYRIVDSGLNPNQKYYYRLSYIDSLTTWHSEVAGPVSPIENWFNTARANVLIGILIAGLVGRALHLPGTAREEPLSASHSRLVSG